MKKRYILIFTMVLSIGAKAQITTSRNTDGGSTYSRATYVKILKAFPNPATTYITFEFQNSYTSGLTIEIYNLPGKRVAAASNITSSTTIQLQNFYRGVYIYKLVDRNGKVMESGKFQVVK